MPNRIIKESICKSDTINALTAEEEVFFYRLLVNCDDYGRFVADADLLASYLFPLRRTLKSSTVMKWLKGVVAAGLVMLYRNNGKEYLQVTTWEHHQQIRNKKSKYPGPYDEESEFLSIDGACNQLISIDCNCPRNPIQSESNTESESNTNPGAPGGVDIRLYGHSHDDQCSSLDNADQNGHAEPTNGEHSIRVDQCSKKPVKPVKVQYAEFVSMTDDEYSSLVARLGEIGAKRCIEILDNYKGASGKKYRSDYRAILAWVIERYEKEQQKGGAASGASGQNSGAHQAERKQYGTVL